MRKRNAKRQRKNTCSQASRLENPEELQLHYNHEKFLFLTVPPLVSISRHLAPFDELGWKVITLKGLFQRLPQERTKLIG
jgi:hypothetical protein